MPGQLGYLNKCRILERFYLTIVGGIDLKAGLLGGAEDGSH